MSAQEAWFHYLFVLLDYLHVHSQDQIVTSRPTSECFIQSSTYNIRVVHSLYRYLHVPKSTSYVIQVHLETQVEAATIIVFVITLVWNIENLKDFFTFTLIIIDSKVRYMDSKEVAALTEVIKLN